MINIAAEEDEGEDSQNAQNERKWDEEQPAKGGYRMAKNDIRFFQKGMIEVVEGRGKPNFPFHSHQSFLVGVIKHGKAILKFNENEYELQDGMTYVVPSNIGFSLTPMTAYSYLTICIKDNLKDLLMRSMSSQTILSNIGQNICSLCESYQSEMSEEDFFDKLSALLGLQKNMDHTAIAQMSGDDGFVKEAVSYIDEHIREKITLNDIAKNVHTSKYHLLREFKKRIGVTPKQYISQGKIRCVRREILTKKTAVQIANEMNFSAQSHLCNVFKKYMALSMNDYKSNVTVVENKQ
jgi:AraC-like DNA-binding protein/mannose-6-phosphate isomerase-like protein (cupin superfamily)